VPPLLDVRNLNIEFSTPDRGILRAVRDLSFAIAAGKVLGLVGESGSGKSITSLAIMRLLPPQARVSGEILFAENGAERDLSKLPDDSMRQLRGSRIGMIFQEPMTALNPVMHVGDQIAEAVLAHNFISKKEAWQRAITAMNDVAIPDAARRARDYPHQLSGGMRQRVMIAMALINRPEILIADEPTTALDVTVQAQILELIRQRQKELGTAVIFVTHDLGVVASFCRRVNVMYAGRVAESGFTEDIFGMPLHPYNASLQQSIPALHRKGEPLFTIPGAPPDLSRILAGCAFAPRCPFAADLCRNSPTTLEEPIPGHSTSCSRVLRGEVTDLRLKPVLAAV
jgi:oligopeptide/dipeptide ABC transporter ATP-binding protein